MKKIRLTFILAMSIGLLQSTVSATNYSCDFESPQDADRWTVVTGTNEWNIVPGFSGNVFYLTMVSYGENLLAANDVTMTDGVASADIAMHNAIGGSATGILVRYVDANNYYMYRLHQSEEKVQLFKKIDGAFTKIGESSVDPIVFDQVYNLKVKVEGLSFTCYLDGVEKFVATDDAIASGGLGFRVFDQSVSIDNVLITPVGDTSVPSITDNLQATVIYNKSNQKIEISTAEPILDICVYTTSGSLIRKIDANNLNQTISTENWNDGIYVISINTQKGKIVKKILKS